LATAAPLTQLEEASNRLTIDATCAAKRGPANRANSAHSPTLKRALECQINGIQRVKVEIGDSESNVFYIIREEIPCF
jgi:hypothetical protein